MPFIYFRVIRTILQYGEAGGSETRFWTRHNYSRFQIPVPFHEKFLACNSDFGHIYIIIIASSTVNCNSSLWMTL